MAEKVGVPTGQISGAGRPVFKTPEGELVSEKSVTIPMGTKFINIPSIHDGVQYSEDEIIDMLKDNKIEATSVHDSMEEAIEAAKARSPKLLDRGGSMESQMDMFEMGGLKDEGGSVDLVSGNDVPNGALKEEVRDDIDAKLSEGEFVLPADVVRYIGLENIMKMRDMAKEGLAKMDAMGQMGNSEEATMDDETDFDSDIDSFIEDLDKDDEVAEFQVGGLAGQPTTPEQQAGQIYSQMTGGLGFLPPGVSPPGTAIDLPKAPVITPGQGPGGIPTYEVKQYIGPNGEIRNFTFVNGEPVNPIPEGFALYDPSKIPEAKTGVPTAKVTEQGGDGDGPDDMPSAKVDPVSGIAKSVAEAKPDGKVASLVKEIEVLDDKFQKSMALSMAGLLFGGGPLSIVGAVYTGYKYNKAAQELNDKLSAALMEDLGSAATNIITDAGKLSSDRFTEKAVQETFTNATKAGASPALAAALATTSSRAFSEVSPDTDLASFEKQTTDIFSTEFNDESGTYSIGLTPGSAQTAMLSEQDFGLFDSEKDRADFYAGRDPTVAGTAPTAPTAPEQRFVNGIPVDDYSVKYTGDALRKESGITTGKLSSAPIGGKFYDDYNIGARSFATPEVSRISPTADLSPNVPGAAYQRALALSKSKQEREDLERQAAMDEASAYSPGGPSYSGGYDSSDRAGGDSAQDVGGGTVGGQGGGLSGPFSKGGLASPKVKAKRKPNMKRGGLASKK